MQIEYNNFLLREDEVVSRCPICKVRLAALYKNGLSIREAFEFIDNSTVVPCRQCALDFAVEKGLPCEKDLH